MVIVNPSAGTVCLFLRAGVVGGFLDRGGRGENLYMRLCSLYIDRFWDKCAGKGKQNLLYILLGAMQYSYLHLRLVIGGWAEI